MLAGSNYVLKLKGQQRRCNIFEQRKVNVITVNKRQQTLAWPCLGFNCYKEETISLVNLNLLIINQTDFIHVTIATASSGLKDALAASSSSSVDVFSATSHDTLFPS